MSLYLSKATLLEITCHGSFRMSMSVIVDLSMNYPSSPDDFKIGMCI